MARAAFATPRRPVSPAYRHRATALAGRPVRGRDAPDRGARLRRVPHGPVAGAHDRRRRRTPTTDHRRSPRRPRPVLAGRPDARVPLGSSFVRRGGTGPPQGSERARGPRADPPVAARRRRGASAHGPAARRDRLRMVARRLAPGGAVLVARCDARRGPPPSRTRGQARARHAATIRLPVRRPPLVHAQRRRLHVRPGRAPVARRHRERRCDASDRRPDLGWGTGLVARRQQDRVHLEPPPRPRPPLASGHPRRGCRDACRRADHRRPGLELRHTDVAARRPDDRGARQPVREAPPASATTCGSSRPTGPTRRRPAAGTYPPGTT